MQINIFRVAQVKLLEMSPNVKESQLRLNLLSALQAASLEGVGLVKREAKLVMIHAACQYLLTMASGYSPPFWKVYLIYLLINTLNLFYEFSEAQ